MRHGGANVAPGGDRRSVTVTFGYGPQLKTLVAQSLPEALSAAERRWGPWSTVESVSTPDTIYNDLTGKTRARWTPGYDRNDHNMTEASKLGRVLGRPLRPGEVGTLRRSQDEVPKLHLARRGRKKRAE